MYYCISRYYVPEWCRWLNADNPICLNYESSTEINLFAYCNNNPIINVDYDGKWSWNNFWMVVAGVAIIAVVTAATVVTCGAAAVALGASAAVVSSVVVGAAIGGVVAGGVEMGMQIATNGIEKMNLASIAIETFVGSAYGAVCGASSTTTSAGVRLALRGARVAISGISSIMHGINQGDSKEEICQSTIKSVALSVFIQSIFIGSDFHTGKLSSEVLELYLLDGKIEFGLLQILEMIGIIVGKNIWRNRKKLLPF